MEGNTAENRASYQARWGRLGEQPTLSVVVTSTGERGRLEDCLRSLLPQCEEAGAEVVVARAADETELRSLAEAYPNVSFLWGPGGTPTSALRTAGMLEANGDIVVLQEDEAVPPDWLSQHARQRRTGAAQAALSTKGVSE